MFVYSSISVRIFVFFFSSMTRTASFHPDNTYTYSEYLCVVWKYYSKVYKPLRVFEFKYVAPSYDWSDSLPLPSLWITSHKDIERNKNPFFSLLRYFISQLCETPLIGYHLTRNVLKSNNQNSSGKMWYHYIFHLSKPRHFLSNYPKWSSTNSTRLNVYCTDFCVHDHFGMDKHKKHSKCSPKKQFIFYWAPVNVNIVLSNHESHESFILCSIDGAIETHFCSILHSS